MALDSVTGYQKAFDKGFKVLSQIRDKEKTPDNLSAAKEKLAQLKHLRDQAKTHQERGITLQLEFEDVLRQNPQDFLTRRKEFQQQYHLSPEELKIFTEVARLSLKKQRLVAGVNNRFFRQAQKTLSAENKNSEDLLHREAGRLIYKAHTGKEPQGDVYWTPSQLAIAIKVFDDADRQVISKTGADAHHDN